MFSRRRSCWLRAKIVNPVQSLIKNKYYVDDDDQYTTGMNNDGL